MKWQAHFSQHVHVTYPLDTNITFSQMAVYNAINMLKLYILVYYVIILQLLYLSHATILLSFEIMWHIIKGKNEIVQLRYEFGIYDTLSTSICTINKHKSLP